MKYWNVLAREALEVQAVTDVQTGLAEAEATARLAKVGANAYQKTKPESIPHMVMRQFADVANLILLLAATLSLIVSIREGNSFLEPIVILVIITINVVLAVTQERGAEKALDALSALNSPNCLVLRGGSRLEIPTEDVVPGDILLLKTGDYIAADARLVEATGLMVDEAALTGESEAVEKDAGALIDEDAPIGDRVNMVFSGCLVTAGNAVAVVTGTGMQTEMGRIAQFLNETQTLQTPLQIRLGRVTKVVSAIAGVAAVALLLTGIQQGQEIWHMLLAAVSLAVAAVPETMNLIVTLTLTQGVKNMVEKHALIRKLPAVETLGSVSVICSDKTGTLTQNRMSVRRLWTPGAGVVKTDEAQGRRLEDPTSLELLHHLAMASNATLEPDGEGGTRIVGDATESAIMRLLIAGGEDPDDVRGKLPRVAEVPFSSSRKMMTSIHELPKGGYLVLTKGAFDRIPFAASSNEARSARQAAHDAFAQDALRVIAIGSRLVSKLPEDGDFESLEHGLSFEGIIGLIDPPRPEAKTAIAEARRAGIKTVMITGDHAATATAIAEQLGLIREGEQALTGRELATMSDDELVDNVRSYSVYARVSPEDKIRIVEAWQEQGEVVAMTGDGVNDAPALKAADVGVAMGVNGTEVAKAAADMVLTDDNFATIVEAVREGRNVFSNIKRTIYFLLVCNLPEIVVMLGAQLLGWGTPLTPVMLLLVNVMGDGIPGLRLAYDTSDPRIMDRKPIGREESFFSPGIVRAIAQQTVACSAGGLVAYYLGAVVGLEGGNVPDHVVGQTMTFLVLALTSVLHVFNVRSRGSLFHRTVLDNKPLIWSAAGVIAAFFVFVAFPPVGQIFGFVALSPIEWAVAVFFGVLPNFTAEFFKLWENHSVGIRYRLRRIRHRRQE